MSYSFLCPVISQFCYDFRVFKFLNSDATGLCFTRWWLGGLHPGCLVSSFKANELAPVAFIWGCCDLSRGLLASTFFHEGCLLPALLLICCESPPDASPQPDYPTIWPSCVSVCHPLLCGPGHVNSTSLYLILHLCNKQREKVEWFYTTRFCEDWMGYWHVKGILKYSIMFIYKKIKIFYYVV